MKRISVLLLAIAACLLLLTAAAFAADEAAETLIPEDNPETMAETPDNAPSGEAAVSEDVPADEVQADETPADESLAEELPAADSSSESVQIIQITTGWNQAENGAWYYYESDSVQKTGWQKSGSSWYYLDPEQDGKMAADTTLTIGEVDYRFKASGAMYTGWYKDTDGSWYYYQTNGALKQGWLYYSKYWYYLDPEQDGKMVSDTTLTIDGNEYRFAVSGKMHTGWYKDEAGKWYYYAATSYYSTTGAMWHGWALCGGYYYYLQDDGTMATGIIDIGDETYWLNSSGRMVSGSWKYYDNSWHYFTRHGNMAKGCWVYLPEYGGNYYFYEDGSMAANTTIDGISVNASGLSTYLASNMTTRIQGYSSPTEYMLVVDRTTCKFYIYKGSTNNWTLYDWSYCATGASYVTPSGTYYLGGGGDWFDSDSCRCFWYRDITGSIAFHSVLYYQDGYSPYTASIMTSTVGARISHGCVRLPFAQNKWVYYNAPSGSTVVIF